MADGAQRLIGITIPTWALCISLALGVSAGTWAISAEVHNYRLQNITTRLGAHEDKILELQAADTLSMIERSANRITIDQITSTLAEIKADVKTLLEHKE